MVYNNPVSYHVDITPEMFAELADEPKFVAIKESSENVRRITDLKNVCGDRYILFCGVDDLVLESLLLGATGWVSGLVNAFPAENRLLWDLATGGRWDEAREVYRWYTPLLHLDTHVKLVQYIKLARPGMRPRLGTSSAPRDCPSWARNASGSWRSSAGASPRDRRSPAKARRQLCTRFRSCRTTCPRIRTMSTASAAHRRDRHSHRRRADPRRDRRRPRPGHRLDGRAAGGLPRPARSLPLGRRQRAARLGRDGRRPALSRRSTRPARPA